MWLILIASAAFAGGVIGSKCMSGAFRRGARSRHPLDEMDADARAKFLAFMLGATLGVAVVFVAGLILQWRL